MPRRTEDSLHGVQTVKDGIYSVKFQANGRDFGTGVCFVENGAIRGGDAGHAYFGKVNTSGDSLNATLTVTPHIAGRPSVFGPIGEFVLELKGPSRPDGPNLAGNIAGVPGQQMLVAARWVRGLPS